MEMTIQDQRVQIQQLQSMIKKLGQIEADNR